MRCTDSRDRNRHPCKLPQHEFKENTCLFSSSTTREPIHPFAPKMRKLGVAMLVLLLIRPVKRIEQGTAARSRTVDDHQMTKSNDICLTTPSEAVCVTKWLDRLDSSDPRTKGRGFQEGDASLNSVAWPCDVECRSVHRCPHLPHHLRGLIRYK